jgi:hypothetical protein
MESEQLKAYKAKQLMYKKAIVKDINLEAIQEKLYVMASECDDVKYFWDTDEETLINALDGDEDQAYEFKMMFGNLCADIEQMQSDLRDIYLYVSIDNVFDDVFVAAKAGNHAGGLLGYDSYEKDYYGLDWGEPAQRESAKRLMRLTKESLIESIQIAFRIFYSYIGISSRYESLKAAFDILKSENTGYLKMVKHIEEIYEKANNDNFYEYGEATKELNRLIYHIPQEAWLQ